MSGTQVSFAVFDEVTYLPPPDATLESVGKAFQLAMRAKEGVQEAFAALQNAAEGSDPHQLYQAFVRANELAMRLGESYCRELCRIWLPVPWRTGDRLPTVRTEFPDGTAVEE